jgi:3-oxoacyl-[acyl-carrier protein] reductase
MSKTAIVTGGARGIGRGCALELAARGYDIALVDLLEPEMKRTAGEIEALGRKALTYQGTSPRSRAPTRSWPMSRGNGAWSISC